VGILITSPFFSETFIILRDSEQDVIKICVGLHVKYLLFFSDRNEN